MIQGICPTCREPLCFSANREYCLFCGYEKHDELVLDIDIYLTKLAKTWQHNNTSVSLCTKKIYEGLKQRHRIGSYTHIGGKRLHVKKYLMRSLRVVFETLGKDKTYYAIPVSKLKPPLININIDEYMYKPKEYL